MVVFVSVLYSVLSTRHGPWETFDAAVVLFNVLGCRLTYYVQAETNAWAWFDIVLRPRKPEGSLERKAQDGHLDSHTAPEL